MTEHNMSNMESVNVDSGTHAGSQVPVGVDFNIIMILWSEQKISHGAATIYFAKMKGGGECYENAEDM